MSRLKWRCRRGMRELDVLLQRYLEQRYAYAPQEEQQAFEALLELPDPQLFAYVVKREQPSDPQRANVVARLTNPESLMSPRGGASVRRRSSCRCVVIAAVSPAESTSVVATLALIAACALVGVAGRFHDDRLDWRCIDDRSHRVRSRTAMGCSARQAAEPYECTNCPARAASAPHRGVVALAGYELPAAAASLPGIFRLPTSVDLSCACDWMRTEPVNEAIDES